MPKSPAPKPHACPQAEAGARIPSRTPPRGNPFPHYAELHCLTNFSFLRGASHPQELVERAAELGYAALAITDRHSLAGVVRAHQAAREHNLHLLIGAELTPIDAPPLVLLAPDRPAYGRLSRLLTRGKLRTPKGECAIYLRDIADFAPGLIAIVLPMVAPLPRGTPLAMVAPLAHRPGASSTSGFQISNFKSQTSQISNLKSQIASPHSAIPNPHSAIPQPLDPLHTYREIFTDALYLAAELACDVPDEAHLAQLAELSRQTGIPLVAANHVHYHVPERRYLQDVLTCIRERCTIAEAGTRLQPNAERHLRSLDEIRRRYAACPELIARTIEIAERCTFNLDELQYEYPHELCPENLTATEFLARLTWKGARERYPSGVPDNVRQQIKVELALINELNYEPYFLTVWDLARFARRRGILCQGRGSAANSAVCYCLGITAVDPARIDLLFERFISHERNEPPDIDVDFEHERREEVFQYIYNKYGRERAAITGEVITYRPRSAVRDVGKVLGLSLDRIDVLAKSLDWWDQQALPEEVIAAAGLDPRDRTIQMLVRLVKQILGFPRHLSQHVGGFVITESPLCEIVPLENAAMPDRTFIEWDKDDIDALGILKVDCLALGMLTAINTLLQGLRDSGIKGLRQGEAHGSRTNVSRSESVAEIRRTGEACIRGNQTDAGVRTVRPDEPDAPRSRLHSQQHRGRERPTKPQGLHSFSDRGASIAGGTRNAVGHRTRTEVSPPDTESAGIDAGSLSNVTGSNYQPSTEGEGLRDSGIEGAGIEGTGAEETGAEKTMCRQCGGSVNTPPQSLNPLIPQSLRDLPPEDPAVYNMICAADTVGVFQIESRAQMSMLPRLRPRCFYDLVIEVAIVRPGPIQGGMVHPYLRRRSGLEPVTYPSEDVKEVLAKTLGVPLFQEQVMRLAVVAAGFTPGEADQLRRAMAAWQRSGTIEKFQLKLIKGMLARGYSKAFAEQIYLQIRGFGEYGFPESHAASFALLVYASAWLKRYHPAAFCAALLNSQPLGFYTPGQLVRDAIAHGVPVLPMDVNFSGYDCTLEHQAQAANEGPIRTRSASEGQSDEATKRRSNEEEPRTSVRAAPRRGKTSSDRETARAEARGSSCASVPASIYGHPSYAPDQTSTWGKHGPALRLGMRLVRGLSEEKVRGIEAAKPDGPIKSLRQLFRRGDVSRETLLRLAAADAFSSLGLNRRQALWHILAQDDAEPPLFAELEPDEPAIALPEMSPDETVVQDYDAIGFSLSAHPIGLVRGELDGMKIRHEGTEARRHESSDEATERRSDEGTKRRSEREEPRTSVRAVPRRGKTLSGRKTGRAEARGSSGQSRTQDNPRTQHNPRTQRNLRIVPNDRLKHMRNGQPVAVAGLVTLRQRPSTAKGIVFMTLEDETGMANLIIRPNVWERDRRLARAKIALIAAGHIERQGEVVHVIVRRFHDLSERLANVTHRSRDFH